MSSIYETKFGNCFKLPNSGLRAYFDHVETGQDSDYATNFYGLKECKTFEARQKKLESILEGWSSILMKIQDQYPGLWDFENDLRGKVGPMSIMKPLEDRLGDIDSYYDSILSESKPISEVAKQRLLKEWEPKIGGLRMRGIQHTVDMMKKSTNSGSPYFTKRKFVIDETLDEMPALFPKKYVYAAWDDKDNYPDGDPVVINAHTPYGLYCAVLGWRGQEGGPRKEDVKQRVVWMMPFAVNMQELRVYQPLIEACQKSKLVPAWVGMDEVDKRITDMFDSKDPNDDVVCTDFSKFDQHFNYQMAKCANSVLERLMSSQGRGDRIISRDAYDWLNETYWLKYCIPLAYKYGEVRSGWHGMASGSGGTNADETITHRCLQHEAALEAHTHLNPNSQCLGDDGVLTYPGIKVEDVVRTYSQHGQEMNLDKQFVHKHECVYLRRWHRDDYRINGVCVGVYSTFRALGRLAEQERYYDPEMWSSKMVALRQLSILENCKHHPLREEFADYCMKGDKYRLGIDIPGFLDDLPQIAKEATDLMPDFLGYTKSTQVENNYNSDEDDPTGIADWWIVKYLKSKA